MANSLPIQERGQSLGEEIANSVSHGVAFLVALIASPILVLSSVQHDNSAAIVGASTFAFTVVLMYLTSTLYPKVEKIGGD